MKKIIFLVLGLGVYLNAQNIVNTIGGNTSADKFIVENNDSEEIFMVRGDGNVGVGNSSQYVRFVVEGHPGSQVGIQYNGLDNHYASIYVNAQTAGATPGYGYLREGYLRAYTSLTSGYGWALSTGEYNEYRLIVNGAGNVGIGTMEPTAKLHIKGDEYPNSFMHFESDPNKDAGFRFLEEEKTIWHIYNNGASSSQFSIRNNAYQPCFIINQDSGKIGINTENPNQFLEVNGKIKIGTDGTTATEGTIRYLNGHFEGYNGTNWIQLDN